MTTNELLQTLRNRFEKNKHRHASIAWEDVESRLNAKNLEILLRMEETGGEPDVIAYEAARNQYLYADCSPESPSGRRSLCYDRQAQDARKEFKPAHNAVEMAQEMGITLLTEQEYRLLQQYGAVDIKTSSWIQTPNDIRLLGGALFMEHRYAHVFVFHNGAQSYYAARGFRGALRI